MDLMAFLRNPFIFKSVTCTLVVSEDRLTPAAAAGSIQIRARSCLRKPRFGKIQRCCLTVLIASSRERCWCIMR